MDNFEKWFLRLWVVWAIFCIVFAIAAVVVGIHFLAKVW